MNIRSQIYDFFFANTNKTLYSDVLEKIPEGSVLLDIGIGTGSALLCNVDLLRQKNIKVVGVDYEASYVTACNTNIAKYEAEDIIEVHQMSIYDFQWPLANSKFAHLDLNYGYFSNSLMIMPDPVEALKHVYSLLKSPIKDQKIYTSQTFELQKSRVIEVAKPLLKFITTIDFGTVTYEENFMKTIEGASLSIDNVTNIEPTHIFSKAVTSGAGRVLRTYALAGAPEDVIVN